MYASGAYACGQQADTSRAYCYQPCTVTECGLHMLIVYISMLKQLLCYPGVHVALHQDAASLAYHFPGQQALKLGYSCQQMAA